MTIHCAPDPERKNSLPLWQKQPEQLQNTQVWCAGWEIP